MANDTRCYRCGGPLNSEFEWEHRECYYCEHYLLPTTWWQRFGSREPYPRWYRRAPVAIFLPWRNLGCLGLRMFFLYIDAYRTWHFPWFGIYGNIGGWRFRPVSWLRQPKRMKRELLDGWCRLWCWLQDHTGKGKLNDLVIRIAERVTPADW